MKILSFTLIFLFPFHLLAQEVQPDQIQDCVGNWEGTLTYLDYSSGNPFSMPANIKIEKGKNDRELLLFNEYPNEPKANNKGKMTLSKDGTKLNGKTIKKVEELAGGILVETEYEGKDDNQKALIRNTYILTDDQVLFRKEVLFNEEAGWILRSEFKYSPAS